MRRITSVVVSLAALVVSSAAQGSLLIDMQLSGGAKSATVTAGQIVNVNIYAYVTGANGQFDEKFQTFGGNVLSSVGSTGINLAGTLTNGGGNISGVGTGVGLSPFVSSGSQLATSVDLDGSGNLDLKAFVARSADALYYDEFADPPQTNVLTIAPDTVRFLVGRAKFTVSASVAAGASTNINFSFAGSGLTASTAMLWTEDNSLVLDGQNGTWSAGTPVVLTTAAAVPEPAALAILGLLSLGLVSRGRKA